MVAFLSLMFWLAWPSCWVDKVDKKTGTQTFLFTGLLAFIVQEFHQQGHRLYQRTLLNLSVPLLHLLDGVFPLVDELLCLQEGLLQIFCSFIQSNLLGKQKNVFSFISDTVTVCDLKGLTISPRSYNKEQHGVNDHLHLNN